jgi:hypothetical protein
MVNQGGSSCLVRVEADGPAVQTDGQWRAVETGIGAVQVAMLALLPAERAATLCETGTIGLHTTRRRGLRPAHAWRGYNYTWAQTSIVLAAHLMAGNEKTLVRTPPSCWVARSPGCPSRHGRADRAARRRRLLHRRVDPCGAVGQSGDIAMGPGGSCRGGTSSMASPRPPGLTRSIYRRESHVTGYCPDWWPARRGC